MTPRNRHHDNAATTAQGLAVALKIRRQNKEYPSLDDVAKAVANEETRRCQKYPDAIHNGKMTTERAATGILAMELAGRYLPAAARYIQAQAEAGDDHAAQIVKEFGSLTIHPELSL